jgi:hypothetical protein
VDAVALNQVMFPDRCIWIEKALMYIVLKKKYALCSVGAAVIVTFLQELGFSQLFRTSTSTRGYQQEEHGHDRECRIAAADYPVAEEEHLQHHLLKHQSFICTSTQR